MTKNPYIRPKPRMTGKITGGHKSAGILDDFPVRKNIDTRAGTITGTPTNANDIVNKAYVDAQIAGIDEHDELGNLDYASAAHTGFEPAKGADDNFVTDAEKVVIGNTSGTNTGDQSITPEGTAVLSTGEANTKFLRADGDNSCSWQVPAGAGDVTAAVNLTDETLVQGDGGAKGIKTSTATVAHIEANTAAQHAAMTLNASATTGGMSLAAQEISNRAATNAQTGYATAAHITAIEANTTDSHASGSDDQISSDFTHDDLIAGTIADHDTSATGAELDTLTDTSDADALHAHATNDAHVAGDGSDHADVATNTAASHAQAHTVASHSDTTGTGAELDTLTDDSMADALHRHSELSASDGTPDACLAVDASGVVTISTDAPGADTQYTAQVLYNTDDVPPAAGGFPVGTLYIQYTA